MRNPRPAFCIAAIAAALFLQPLLAFADCGWNAARTFFGCNGSVSIANSVGRTLPVLSDTVRFNPAAIPTVSTPVGVEATYNSKTEGDKKFQASLLKGAPGVGVAAVSWTENNFATPNVQKIINKDFASAFGNYLSGSNTGYRLGGAAALPFFSATHLSVGGSYGQGRVSGSTSAAFGVTADTGFISLGLSQNSETIVPGLPKGTTRTYSAGLTTGGFYLGYSQMHFEIAGINLPTIHFFSLRVAMKNLAIYLAAKKDIKDETLAMKTYVTGNAQFSLSKKIVLGYVYGLYDGAHSLSIQLYF